MWVHVLIRHLGVCVCEQPKVKPMVMELCAKHGLEYREHGFWQLNMMVWDGLWDVAASPMARLNLWEMITHTA